MGGSAQGATALVLVDIQNDYFEAGLWPVSHMNRVAENAALLLADARHCGDLVVHIRHEAASDSAPFFRPGTAGADLHASVTPLAQEAVVVKHRPNSFQDTDLHARLQTAGITDVVICGAMTQMCIDATARAARDLGYVVHLASDACGAKEANWQGAKIAADQVQGAFLSALGMSYATVQDTQSLIAAQVTV